MFQRYELKSYHSNSLIVCICTGWWFPGAVLGGGPGCVPSVYVLAAKHRDRVGPDSTSANPGFIT